MPSPQYDAVLTKVKHAEALITALCGVVSEFAGSCSYEAVTVDNVESGFRETILHVNGSPDPPMSIGLLAGDIVHNLRAALDHLMWQLVIANGQVPDDQTMFPISREERLYLKAREGRKVRGIDAEALRRLDALKPYKGGNGDLWELHELDIVDKHRLLLTAVSASTTATLDLSAAFEVLHAMMRAEDPDVGPLPDLSGFRMPLRTAEPDRAVDGAVLVRAPIGHTDHDNTSFRFEVVLELDGQISNESLPAQMARLHGAVHGTIGQFEDLLD
jgi:hypothetical protein